MAQQLRALAAPAEDPGSSLMAGGSQPPVTSVPGDLTHSSDLCGHWTHTVHRHTQTHKIEIVNLFLEERKKEVGKDKEDRMLNVEVE